MTTQSESDTAPAPPVPETLKWYFQTPYLLLILGSLGPLVLPLVWWHPSMKLRSKCGLTLLVLALTGLLIWLLLISIRLLLDAIDQLRAML